MRVTLTIQKKITKRMYTQKFNHCLILLWNNEVENLSKSNTFFLFLLIFGCICFLFSAFVSDFLSAWLAVCLSVWLCVRVCMYICLSVELSIYLFLCLFVCLSVDFVSLVINRRKKLERADPLTSEASTSINCYVTSWSIVTQTTYKILYPPRLNTNTRKV